MPSHGRSLCTGSCVSHRWSRYRLSPASLTALQPRLLRQHPVHEGTHDGRPPSWAWIASRFPPRLLASPSGWQRKGFCFYFDEHATDGAHVTVEMGGFGAFQIGEEASDPRRHVLFEQ